MWMSGTVTVYGRADARLHGRPVMAEVQMMNGSVSGVLVNNPATDPAAAAVTSSTTAVRIRVYIPDVDYRVRASYLPSSI